MSKLSELYDNIKSVPKDVKNKPQVKRDGDKNNNK